MEGVIDDLNVFLSKEIRQSDGDEVNGRVLSPQIPLLERHGPEEGIGSGEADEGFEGGSGEVSVDEVEEVHEGFRLRRAVGEFLVRR